MMVFHASPNQGLKMIHRRSSALFPQELIFASRDLYIASLFLQKTGGDFVCSIMKRANQIFLIERIKDGLYHRYTPQPGSIYVLPDRTFQSRTNLWQEELVSETDVITLAEIEISNTLEYILRLSNLSHINIIKYEDRKGHVEHNDADLVRLCNLYGESAERKPEMLQFMRTYHPDVLGRSILDTI